MDKTDKTLFFFFPEAAVLSESESTRNELANALSRTSFLAVGIWFWLVFSYSTDTELLKNYKIPLLGLL